MAVPFLTPAQLQKSQAEAEGYANGPLPALNSQNADTQFRLGNPQLPETSPTPVYPGTTDTPNTLLRMDGMNCVSAQDLLLLDQDHGSEPLAAFGFFNSTGHQQPAICAVAYEPCVTTANHVNAHLFYLASAVLVNKISLYVGVGVAGQTVNVGIYSQLGTLIMDSGPMPVSGSAVTVVASNTSLNILMQPGWYYYAFSCTSVTPTFLAINQNNIAAYYAFTGVPRHVLASTPLSGGALPLSLGTILNLAESDVTYHPLVIFSQV